MSTDALAAWGTVLLPFTPWLLIGGFFFLTNVRKR
jgi:hypothetical protein